jgi:hypothetical protein
VHYAQAPRPHPEDRMTQPPTGPQAWTALLLAPCWWPWQIYLGWRMNRQDRHNTRGTSK